MRCVHLSALISPSNVSIAEQSIMNYQVGNELERRRQEIFARCGTSSTATAKEKVCVKRKQLQPKPQFCLTLSTGFLWMN